MTQLEGCIRHWESTLDDTEYLLDPSTRALIAFTIKSLKELQKLNEVRK